MTQWYAETFCVWLTFYLQFQVKPESQISAVSSVALFGWSSLLRSLDLGKGHITGLI